MQISAHQLRPLFSLLKTYGVPPCIKQMQLSGGV
jgi:hypothetical protein